MSPEHFTADTVVPAKVDKRTVAALKALVAFEQAEGKMWLATDKGLAYRRLETEALALWELVLKTPGAHDLWVLAHDAKVEP